MLEFLTLSLLVPFAYLSILIGSMATFSHLYRSRQVTAKQRLAPYFSTHTPRNIYLSLLHMQDTDSSTKVPDSILRAALLARACEDIRRIREVQLRKPALAQLLQRGVVGDEMFQRLQRAEQELELELKDVVAEANALSGSGGPNGGGTWGQSIFQSANEMVQNQMLREKIDGVKAGLGAEKERWEKTRESARRELLGEEKTSVGTANAAVTEAPVLEQVTPNKLVTGSSDEDGVIVETPATEVSSLGDSGGGKNKKKKGKK